MVQSVIKPTVHKVGFISPPSWFDISPMEFLRIAPKNTIVIQTVMRPPDFDYSVEQFLNSVPELGICFDSLSAAGANVVAQFGYPFSFVHGWEKAQQIQKNIQRNKETRFVMMGVEVVYALRHLNCTSIAVASTYYSAKMTKILAEYLATAGLNISHSENWLSQGIVKETDSDVFIGEGELDPMAWETPIHAVEKAVRSVSQNAHDTDGILVTGGGMRLLDIVDRLEKEVGKPIIGGDLTLYWGILRRLGIKESIRGHGKLLANLV
jgi:maleate cis-trans isomerase